VATQGKLVPRFKLASSDTALEANLDEDLGRHRFAYPSVPKFKPLHKASDGFPDVADLDSLHQSPHSPQSTSISSYEPPSKPKGDPKPMDNRDHGDVPVEDDEDARSTKGLRKSAGKFPSFFAQQASASMNKLKPALMNLYRHELFGQAVDQLEGQTYQLGIETGLDMGRDGVKKLKKKDVQIGILKKAFALQGHTDFQKLRIAIENRKGSVRKGVNRHGTPWRTEMKHHYGYIKGTKGADGEEVDAYVGPDESAEHAYVVHQNDPETGEYDEDKVMLGFSSKKDAKEAFLAHYDDPKFLGPIKEVSMDRLADLLTSKKELSKIARRLGL